VNVFCHQVGLDSFNASHDACFRDIFNGGELYDMIKLSSHAEKAGFQ